jgi:hypothetical protein
VRTSRMRRIIAAIAGGHRARAGELFHRGAGTAARERTHRFSRARARRSTLADAGRLPVVSAG